MKIDWNLVITIASMFLAILSFSIMIIYKRQSVYEKLKKELITVKERIKFIENFKYRILLSRIYEIDITFQESSDKILFEKIYIEIINPINEIDYLLKGLILISNIKKDNTYIRDIKQAEDYLREAINISISNHKNEEFISECYNYLGVLFDEINRYDKAIKMYDKSKEYNNRNSKPYYNLACSYSKLLEARSDEEEKNDLLKIIEENLDKALELHPKDYITALKDYDLVNIQNESFFNRNIKKAAHEYLKYDSFINKE